MIIVSQNKEKIFNFEHILSIQIMATRNENERKIEYYIFVYDNEEDACKLKNILGVYSTEERAKNILQEIVEMYSVNKTLYTNNLIAREYLNEKDCMPFVYEMQKE